MIGIRASTDARLLRVLAAHRDAPLSYEPEGMTRASSAPRGYAADRTRVRLGHGGAVLERAVGALRSWRQFDLGWVRLVPSDEVPRVGLVVAVTARLGPLSVVNVCRVLRVDDEPRRFAVTYGTLDLHVERGEERFMIEQDAAGYVWYDILAMSRPKHPLAWVAYPFSRAMQRRFARGSARAMTRAVA